MSPSALFVLLREIRQWLSDRTFDLHNQWTRSPLVVSGLNFNAVFITSAASLLETLHPHARYLRGQTHDYANFDVFGPGLLAQLDPMTPPMRHIAARQVKRSFKSGEPRGFQVHLGLPRPGIGFCSLGLYFTWPAGSIFSTCSKGTCGPCVARNQIIIEFSFNDDCN